MTSSLQGMLELTVYRFGLAHQRLFVYVSGHGPRRYRSRCFLSTYIDKQAVSFIEHSTLLMFEGRESWLLKEAND